MVVAMLDDGSVTLKRLRRDNGQVFLVPENPAFQPIAAPSAKILGRVIGVMRKY
jgi:repressor LexA